MVRKRFLGMIIAGIALTGLLTGCGDGSVEKPKFEVIVPESVDITMQPMAAGPEAPDEVKLVYDTGKLTKEEENVILDNMKILRQNLEVSEYVGEGLHMVSSEEWLETMALKLYEGSRTYTLQKGEEILLRVLVAYGISGDLYSSVYCNITEDKVILLRQEGDVTQLVQSQVTEEGQYDGNYEMWQINSATGEIRTEQGTYADGIIVGECRVAVCSAPAGSAFDLWSNREGFAYEISTIIYDQSGKVVSMDGPQSGASPTPEPSQTPAATQTPSATPKPTATPKPAATKKPAATQKPTVTPAPSTPEPEPDPDPEPQEPETPQEPQMPEPPQNDNDNGGSDSGSTNGDVDIDWSDDML